WPNFFRRIRWSKAFTQKRKNAAGPPSRSWSCAGNCAAGLCSRITRRKRQNGGSGFLCRSREAAGGHRPRGGRVCAPEKEWAKLYGALPISLRKDAVVCRSSGKTDLSLLRLRCGRRCVQVCHGDG